MLTLEPYVPEGVKPFAFHGSTCNIGRLEGRPNAILKYYKEAWWDLSKPMNDGRRSLYRSRFQVEEAILRHLGDHPRVVKYIGTTSRPHGIWLVEAQNGDLQHYLEQHKNKIEDAQRYKWCKQAAEGVSYIHSKGVLHCDLRPANCLLDEYLDLALCDFGGSRFGELSGKGLPDSGFFDPNDKGPASESMDIFGLGSLMYTIMVGQFPHESLVQNMADYDVLVDQLFSERLFPDVEYIKNGQTIRGCWEGRFTTAIDVLYSLEQEK